MELARAHLEEVRRRTVDRVDRTTAAVKERLQSEIQHWDHRANQLKDRNSPASSRQRHELRLGPDSGPTSWRLVSSTGLKR